MDGLSERLRTLRNSTMMSQEKFAKQIGSSQSAINRYENDQSEPFKIFAVCYNSISCYSSLSLVF